MEEPLWLSRRIVDALHFEQLREHGDFSGVRDENALESALARPRRKWTDEPDSDLAALAAAYGYGLATRHGYQDGNKRVAFVAMYVFVGLEGWEIVAREPEVVSIMLALADNRLEEDALAGWLRNHLHRVEIP